MSFWGNQPKEKKEYEDGVFLPLDEIRSIDNKAVVDPFYANFAVGNSWLYKEATAGMPLRTPASIANSLEMAGWVRDPLRVHPFWLTA